MAGAHTTIQPTEAQRLDASLSSVAEVVARLQAVCAPCEAISVEPPRALGAFLAHDVSAAAASPASHVALVDGRAASSLDLIGASPMSPAFLAAEPPFVCVGDGLPLGCDCVIDASLVVNAGGVSEVHGSAAPGEGVRRAGEDWKAGAIIARAGVRLSAASLLALEAAGVREISVRRPSVRIVFTPARNDETSRFVAALAHEDGAIVDLVRAHGRDAASIALALAGDYDAAIIVGGTGVGDADHSVTALRQRGEVLAHGVALDPGRTSGAGVIGGRAVFCLPGRFDGALAAFLALARPILTFLAGAEGPAGSHAAPLTRKVSSTVGVSQLVLLSAEDDGWSPLCVGDVTLSHLLRAQAYMIIPEGSEGMAEGAVVRPLPLPGRSHLS